MAGGAGDNLEVQPCIGEPFLVCLHPGLMACHAGVIGGPGTDRVGTMAIGAYRSRRAAAGKQSSVNAGLVMLHRLLVAAAA